MDGDEPPNNRRTPASRNNLRNRNDKNRYQLENWEYALTPEVHRARSHEDKLISLAVKTNLNSRYHELTKKNGRDIEGELRELVAKKLKEEVAKSMIVDGESESRDGNKGSSTLTDKEISTERDDEETMASSQEQSTLSSDTSVLHYPRNATGYYRGLWLQTNINKTISIDDDEDQSQGLPRKVTPKEMIPWAQTQLQHRQADVSLLLLPPNVYIEPDTTNSENSTSEDNRDVTAGKGETDARYTSSSTPKLSLTREAGRAAFQLYYRPIPAMNELSIVDGLVKLYDGMTTSFVSRRTDVLLQVRGVMIHSIGKMSLVTLSPGTETQRSLLAVRKVIKNNHAEELHLDEAKKNLINDEVDLEGADENDEEEATDRRRRLQWTISDLLSRSDSHESFESEKALIRQEVMHLYSSYYLDNDDVLDLESAAELKGWTRLQSNDEGFSDDDEHHLHFPSSRRIQQTTHENDDYVDTVGVEKNSLSADVNSSSTYDMLSNELLNVGETRNGTEVSWHRSSLVASPDQLAPIQYVYPYPYVMDDDEGTIQKSSSPATRRLPGREQALEANGANCEFEINLDVQATKWTVGEWRLSLEHRMRMGEVFNPHLNISHSAIVQLKRSQYLLMLKSQLDFLEKQIPREALVMTLTGDIESKNCDFSSFINVTAMRTNWENTTAKAINYSFYMMLTCLTQIVILLRQLLHTQTQSVASNVSLLCIGWQTVLDAIICICHIFLCLVMQPLFTAFASVAFFKLLIFCIIELKYMAIIIQARNSANNTSLTQEDLRRQITLLHLKFYSALVLAIVAFWYVGQSNRSLFILLLYSFWVPQIILNIITEARKPLHPYFLYGMSLTRSVAPIYVFAVRNNFLREVNPDFPLEPRMCQMLIVWISKEIIVVDRRQFLSLLTNTLHLSLH
jgi:hypothetical protein